MKADSTCETGGCLHRARLLPTAYSTCQNRHWANQRTVRRCLDQSQQVHTWCSSVQTRQIRAVYHGVTMVESCTSVLSRINELATRLDPVQPVTVLTTLLVLYSGKIPLAECRQSPLTLFASRGDLGNALVGEFTPAEVGQMNVMPKAPTPPSPLCGVPEDCCSALGSYMVVTQLQVREIHPFLEEWGAQETSSIL